LIGVGQRAFAEECVRRFTVFATPENFIHRAHAGTYGQNERDRPPSLAGLPPTEIGGFQPEQDLFATGVTFETEFLQRLVRDKI